MSKTCLRCYIPTHPKHLKLEEKDESELLDAATNSNGGEDDDDVLIVDEQSDGGGAAAASPRRNDGLAGELAAASRNNGLGKQMTPLDYVFRALLVYVAALESFTHGEAAVQARPWLESLKATRFLKFDW